MPPYLKPPNCQLLQSMLSYLQIQQQCISAASISMNKLTSQPILNDEDAELEELRAKVWPFKKTKADKETETESI